MTGHVSDGKINNHFSVLFFESQTCSLIGAAINRLCISLTGIHRHMQIHKPLHALSHCMLGLGEHGQYKSIHEWLSACMAQCISECFAALTNGSLRT